MFKKGYTLAEVVITILIIAILVGVSIKLTKNKLDNVLSYTYYNAYSILNTSAGEMVFNFKDNDEYMGDDSPVGYIRKTPAWLKIANFFKDGLDLRAWADASDGCRVEKKISGETVVSFQIGAAEYSFIADESGCDAHDGGYCGCIKNYYAALGGGGGAGHSSGTYDAGDTGTTGCTATLEDVEACHNSGGDFKLISCTCVPKDDPTPSGTCSGLPANASWTDSTYPTCSWACNSGYTQSGSTCVQEEPPTVEPTGCVEHTCPDGQSWNSSTCSCEGDTPEPGITPEEPSAEPTVGGIVPTVPRTGLKFCQMFVGMVNTKVNTKGAECSGNPIADGTTDFTEKTPDATLRNGMLVYNLSQNYAEIEALKLADEHGKYFDKPNSEGVKEKIYIDEYGYKVYIDVDGVKSRNDKGGQLWVDVFPFYVTLSGKVIPAYDMTEGAATIGGNDKSYLQISASDEYYDNSKGQTTKWLLKSRPFKTAACTTGYLNEKTSYCSTEPAVATYGDCKSDNHDCKIKTVIPIKWFN